MEALIRAREERDLEDLFDVYSQPRCIAGTMQLPYRSQRELRERLAKASPNRHSLVAEIEHEGGRRVVGTLALHVEERPRRSHVASLGLFVHDDFQNNGIGTRLMEAGLDLARNWLQITRVELSVYTDNPPAIHLYEKLGFERKGTLRRYSFRDGEYVDVHTMAWLK